MRKKLRSQRGIAMIFAIVAFVVVMVLGTVIYTAGYANYSKLFGRRNSKQEYYTLISTARYLKGKLDCASITVTDIWVDTDNDKVKNPSADEIKQEIVCSAVDERDGWVVKLLENAHSASAGTVEFSAEISSDGYAESVSAVLTTFQLDHEAADPSAMRGQTRYSVLTLFCKNGADEDSTRKIVVELSISPSYLDDMTGTTSVTVRKEGTSGTEEETMEVLRQESRTEYTLRVGEIRLQGGNEK